MARILIPDYLGQHVRAGIRSLARQGDTCDLAWERCRVKSSYIRNFYPITSSSSDDKEYIDDIIGLCKKNTYDFILVFRNESYYAASRHLDLLQDNGVCAMVPRFESFTKAHDKQLTYELCRKHNIKTPEILNRYEESDIASIARNVNYPVVIKARSGTGVFRGLRYANNMHELLKYYDEIRLQQANTGAENFESPLIQEYIPGYIHDACTLSDNGDVITILTQVRKLMYPIYGGVGAINVTTHENSLADLARKILEELDWHGPAQVEFKYDERDHEYKLIEINPKLWGTLDLSIQVGVDFPGMIRDILMGKTVARNVPYPEGIRYKFMFPQAVMAYLQLVKEFGLRAVFDSFTYSKTYYDLDPEDCLFDLNRVRNVVRTLFREGFRSPNDNLGKSHINSL